MNPVCFTEPTSSAWKRDHDGAYAKIICDYPQVIGKVLLLQPPSSTSRIPFMSLQRGMVLDLQLETPEAHSSLSKWFDALKHRVNTTQCHLSPLEALRQEWKWRWVTVFRYPVSLGESKKCKEKESKKRLTSKAGVWKDICITAKKIPCIDNSCDTIFHNNWAGAIFRNMMVCSTFTGFAWMQQNTDCAFVYQKFIISDVGQRLSPFVSALPVIFSLLFYF